MCDSPQTLTEAHCAVGQLSWIGVTVLAQGCEGESEQGFQGESWFSFLPQFWKTAQQSHASRMHRREFLLDLS